MPFTANRQFKANPRLLARAAGMHYWTADGRQVLDGVRRPVVRQRRPRPQGNHRRPSASRSRRWSTRRRSRWATRAAFELANAVVKLLPAGLDHVFFTNSGSESVDTALKIALAYHRVRGEGTRTRLIGRERGYHGVGFGGISVGGMVNNRKFFGDACCRASITCRTRTTSHTTRTRAASPTWGAHLADELERLVALHDASTIAAVIVEPVAGSTGVLLPPKGYLQQLRDICTKHGILLIFDEVITGFGRLGAPFAAQRLRRDAGHDHDGQGTDQRRGADGRRGRAQARSTTRSCRDPRTPSSCSTATRIRRIRWRAPPGIATQRDLRSAKGC